MSPATSAAATSSLDHPGRWGRFKRWLCKTPAASEEASEVPVAVLLEASLKDPQAPWVLRFENTRWRYVKKPLELVFFADNSALLQVLVDGVEFPAYHTRGVAQEALRRFRNDLAASEQASVVEQAARKARLENRVRASLEEKR